MTLNRLIVLLFAAVFIFSACGKKNRFSVSGMISHAEGDTIYLEELLVSSRKPVAEVKIDKKGRFKITGEAKIPTFYLLKLSENNFITLLIDSVEQINIEADAANFGKEYIVEGSLGSMQIKELNESLLRTEHKLDSLRSLYTLYQNNPDYENQRNIWDEQYRNLIQEQAKFSTNFVMNNPFSMASVFALYQKYKDQSYVIRDLQTMRTAASALHSIYPNSEYVKSLYDNTLQILKQEQAAKMKQFISENGENSPNISLPDVNGNNVALNSLRGKVVLVQFWAAEDRNSRILNPLLVEAYKKYKSRGFEIYQVNVGANRSEWIDAIDADNLSWINVGDLKGSVAATQVYNIQAVPYNYLLGKNGEILGKDLKGTVLDKALAQALKQ